MIDKVRIYKNIQKRREQTAGLNSRVEPVTCPVCNKEIKEEDLPACEYVKTRRGTDIFVHHDCVKKWGE